MELYISSGVHLFSRNDDRIDKIEGELKQIDAVFVETRQGDPGFVIRLLNWIVSPLILLFLHSWITLIDIVGLFVSSDLDAAEKLCEDHNASLYEVDKPMHKIISRDRYIWGVANWGLISFPVILVYANPAPKVILVSIMLIILSTMSVSMAFLAGTMPERNLHMLREIDEISEELDAKGGCLITGGSHESGLRDYSNIFDGITVVGPEAGSILSEIRGRIPGI